MKRMEGKQKYTERKIELILMECHDMEFHDYNFQELGVTKSNVIRKN